MTDDRRADANEVEWPSEDLSRAGGAERPAREVEWPAEDVARTAAETPYAATPPPPTPRPEALPAPHAPGPPPGPPPAEPVSPPPPGPPPDQPAPPQAPPPLSPFDAWPYGSEPAPPSHFGQPPAAPSQVGLPPAAPGQGQPPPAAPAGPYAPAPRPSYDEYDSDRPPPSAPQGAFGQFGAPAPFLTPPGLGPYAAAPAPEPEADEADEDPRRKYFRHDIQGLRAVAVIAVLLFHVGVPVTAGGFVGVDVFYVISGFLITALLLREGEQTGRIDLLAFYARRMRRLLPAALTVIVVTLALSAVIVSPLRLTEIAGDAAAAALYVANFRFALEATNYLAVEAQSPLLHYWTLGVEEQFYLVWPLLLLVVLRFLPMRLVAVAIGALAIGSFVLSIYWTTEAPALAFFTPFTRAWELAAGALIALGFLRIPQRLPSLTAPVLVVAGLALVVAAVVLLDERTPFPGAAALLPVVGAVLVIVGGAARPTLPGRIILSNPVSRYFGHISYSLYLWHWPILILIPLAIENDDMVTRLALAGAAIVVAGISTELIERPFRSSHFFAARSRGSVRLGLGASVVVGVVALFMSGAISIPLPVPSPQRDPVVVELAEVRRDLPAHQTDGCHLEYEDIEPSECVYGDPESTRTAVLWGDSHAAQWFPAIRAYAEQEGLRLEVHTKNSCTPLNVTVFEPKRRRTYDECDTWRRSIRQRIRDLAPEVVYVGSSRDYDIEEDGRFLQSREIYPFWQEEMTAMLRMLTARAENVVVLAETPYLNFDPVDCLADPKIDSCDPATILSIDTRYAALEAAAAEAGGAQLLSINTILCPGESCPTVVDDIVVFRDNHHLTGTYMERLAEPIGNLLEGRAPFPTPLPSPDASGQPALAPEPLPEVDEAAA